MRLSTRAQYAVRAMVDLALYSNDKPVSLKEIAQREEIPLSYLEQLFFRLKNGGIVTSIRGPGGGYSLGRAAAAISVADILIAVEGPTADELPDGHDEGSCWMTQALWRSLNAKMLEHMQAITLAKLADEQRANGVQIVKTATF